VGKASRSKVERRASATAGKRKPERKWLFPAVIAGLVVAGIVVVVLALGGRTETSSPADARTSPLAHGEAAPPLSGKGLDGEEISLESSPGKPTLVVFWAHWCPHCQKEMPPLQDLYEKNKTKYDMIGVATAIGRQPAAQQFRDPEAFIDSFDLTMPTIVDEDDSIAARWGVTGYPMMYVLGPDGRVTDHFSGEVPMERIIAALDAAGVADQQ
jgi:thiol-disulfide isomerase/thioredoxin